MLYLLKMKALCELWQLFKVKKKKKVAYSYDKDTFWSQKDLLSH